MAQQQPPLNYNDNPLYSVNRSQAEQAVFIELVDDSRFPAISTVNYIYPDQSAAFNNKGVGPLSSITVYPKFATLNYIVNPEDMTNAALAQDGFVFADSTTGSVSGDFSTIQVVSACKIGALSATNSTVGNLTAFELPQNFTINGPIKSFTIKYGAVIAYKI